MTETAADGLAITMSTTAAEPSGSPKNGVKRKRGSLKGALSPDSDDQPFDRPDSQHDANGSAAQASARQAATKRACNECRQQKTEPEHVDCSRCRRLKLDCRIDANFKRIGKRSRNAAMEREIQELRAQLETRGGVLPFGNSHDLTASGSHRSTLTNAEILAQQPDPLTALHQGAVGSLIDLKNSASSQVHGNLKDRPTRSLGNIQLSASVVDDLFRNYFEHYHAHIPVLDPTKPADYFFDCSPLLFWSVVAVGSRRYVEDPTLLTGLASPLSALLWTTIAQVPQNYHVVKAMCLLCTWPLPTKSTSTDPTFILSGIMMQIALQTGLHRPSHVQDFSRIRVDLREEDIADRVKTWAACNIVAQSVSTGTGQPPKTIYDYTLTHVLEPNEYIPSDLFWRLQIERFCNKVSQKLYNNRDHPIGISSDTERAAWISLLVTEYNRIDREVQKHDSLVEKLYLHAAGFHLRLSAFFDSPQAQNYANDLLHLYFAVTKFLSTALELTTRTATTPAVSPEASTHAAANGVRKVDTSSLGPLAQGNFRITSLTPLKHASNYIMQMLLAGGFTLMKLLNSFFAQHIDTDAARRLFNHTIRAIRAISVSNNDLPGRLAEVLAQLWRSSGAGLRPLTVPTGNQQHQQEPGNNGNVPADNSLQLKVRCRMSMSLLFDSVWRWREEHLYKMGMENSTALANLDNSLEHPTDVDASDSTPAPPASIPTNVNHASKEAKTIPATPMGPAALLTANDRITSMSSHLSSHGQGLDPTLTTDDSTALPFGSGPLAASSSGMEIPGITDVGYEVFDPLTWMLDGDLGEYGIDDSMLTSTRDPWA